MIYCLLTFQASRSFQLFYVNATFGKVYTQQALVAFVVLKVVHRFLGLQCYLARSALISGDFDDPSLNLTQLVGQENVKV